MPGSAASRSIEAADSGKSAPSDRNRPLAHSRRWAAQILQLLVVVEHGPTSAIFENPQHEYTRRLLDAIPGTAIPGGSIPRFERSAS